MTAVELTGGCQCGGVRYVACPATQKVVICHCTDCQRQSGSAFGMILLLEEEDFRLTRGALKFYGSLADTGRDKQGAFCPDCGTRIYHKVEMRPGKIVLKPGTLDDTSQLTPSIHIWTASKQPWTTIPEGMETHEKNPV